MTFGIYSIRDVLTGFMTPVIEQSDAAACRNFRMACDTYPRSGSSMMQWKPEDFSFFKLGTFDSETGIISPFSQPELLTSGFRLNKEGDSE